MERANDQIILKKRNHKLVGEADTQQVPWNRDYHKNKAKFYVRLSRKERADTRKIFIKYPLTQY